MSPLAAQLQAILQQAAVAALQEGADVVAGMARQIVGVNCTAYGHPPSKGQPNDHRHSLPREPPRKESGEGQASIGVEHTKDGAKVGTSPIAGGASAHSSRTYMAMYDDPEKSGPKHRPWFIPLFTGRYKPELDKVIDGVLRYKLGGSR